MNQKNNFPISIFSILKTKRKKKKTGKSLKDFPFPPFIDPPRIPEVSI